MPFRIEFSPEAIVHLQELRAFERARVVQKIEAELRDRPLMATRNRKPMKSNLIASRELRVGDFRVYYDVDPNAEQVLVRAIGVKQHNRVFIGGEEVNLI